MKFLLRDKTPPKLGDTRAREKFLWLPMIHNSYFYWFETVILEEHYMHVNHFDGRSFCYKSKWVVVRVVDNP